MKVLIVIPSRYGSTRFEGKPLVDIAGKSLVRRTYEQALKANLDSKVVVATDDERIYNHVAEFGNCMMTSPAHLSGTDRCFEVYDKLRENYDVLINLQGDEPFIQPSQVESLADCFANRGTQIATLRKPIQSQEELMNPNIVKVLVNQYAEAIYFSRQAIPYIRGAEQNEWHKAYPYYRHVGIYGFSTDVIQLLKHLPASNLEKAESLEQLRWLEYSFKIRVADTDFISPAIDAPSDLVAVDNFLKSNPSMI